MPVGGSGGGTGDRHEVDHFTYPGFGEEPGDENRRIRIVELMSGERFGDRTDPEPSPRW